MTDPEFTGQSVNFCRWQFPVAIPKNVLLGGGQHFRLPGLALHVMFAISATLTSSVTRMKVPARSGSPWIPRKSFP
jgi:hypothetical protein